MLSLYQGYTESKNELVNLVTKIELELNVRYIELVVFEIVNF